MISMKPICTVIAALGTCFAVSASAQTSVTLYGIVDAGFTYTSNQRGATAYQATQGNYSGSRWGLKGTEDIGGGSRVLFDLENGFNPENGAALQAGRLFGRAAWVGIANNMYGTVTLGRQYNSVQDFLTYLQANTDGALSAYANAVYDTDAINNTYRTQNSVKYTSPMVAGLTASALYGFSNQPGAFANNRTWSVGADYLAGPLRLDAAYAQLSDPAANTSGAVASDNYYSLATSIIADVKNNRVFGGGGAYTLGVAMLALLYTNVQFDLLNGGSLHFANYEANIRYLLNPALQLAAGYIFTTQRSNTSSYADAHYHQFALGANYFLSKRTDLYLNVVYQRASGADAWIELVSAPSSNNHQLITTAGIRHRF
ncbi:porin [Paraburkholderia fungorum]